MSIQQPTSELLCFIDEIQRLGVAYHFHDKIEEALRLVYARYVAESGHTDDEDASLHTVALKFRLLRAEGYNVSCELFNKFKDENGKFKTNLIDDKEGLLSLYEAAYLRTHRDDVLKEALTFATTHLESMVRHEDNPLDVQVTHALRQSLWRGIPRVEARRYISVYEKKPNHSKVLLMLAKLDFNMIQSIHREEINDIARYWKDLDLAMNLPHARHRNVESFFMSMVVAFEPKYSFSRRILAIMIGFLTYIDDTYDAYGTLDELKLFTEAIQRWDIDCKGHLPKYMQVLYQAFLEFYDSIEKELAKEGKSYRMVYAKETMKAVVRAYFDEAVWLNENYIPTVEEHLKVSLVSAAHTAIFATFFAGMGDIVTEEVLDWVLTDPKILRASNILSRIQNDIAGHEFEQERGHVASTVECFMKQYGVSKEMAVNELKKLIENGWTDINEDLLKPTDVSRPLLLCIFNAAKWMDTLYKYEDSMTHLLSPMVDGIKMCFVNPIPI